jgi:hypothetical protein
MCVPNLQTVRQWGRSRRRRILLSEKMNIIQRSEERKQMTGRICATRVQLGGLSIVPMTTAFACSPSLSFLPILETKHTHIVVGCMQCIIARYSLPEPNSILCLYGLFCRPIIFPCWYHHTQRTGHNPVDPRDLGPQH